MSLSTAVSADRVSRIVGYTLQKGTEALDVPYLPQRIAVLGEANDANQSGLTTAPFSFTSAKEVGDKYGYGSPLHQIARILRPISGGGVGSIPTVIYPQVSDVGASATVIKFGVTGTATANATHYIVISGRDNVDGEYYAVNVEKDDTASAIEAKIIDSINNVLGCPGTAADNAGDIDFTTKWKGASSAEVNITFDTGDDDAGLTYAEISKTDGTGDVDVTTSLNLFGDEWNTVVINPYPSKISDFETVNGVPDDTTPTGRYLGITFKPFIALFGETDPDKADLITITDASARKDQVTNVLCPAPNSNACSWEAAANVATLQTPIFQNYPHLDTTGKSYPDMPVPSDDDIGDMADYENRDYLAKRGCSTVMLKNGKFTIQEIITTYHPDGEVPPQFRYVRNLNIDWNIRYMYYILEQDYVVDHSIAESAQAIRVDNVIKPKQWIQQITGLADQLAEQNIIVDIDFMKDSIQVATSTTNPDRLETYFKYKRSSYARISATTAEANFAFNIQ